MNSLEKRVWAAVFAFDFMEGESIRKPLKREGYDGTIGVADRAVMALRRHIEKHGRLHGDEDLELERRAEEDIVGSATEDIIVEIGADVPIEVSLRCIKACEAIVERFPGLTAYVGAPPGTKVSGVMVKAEVAARFEGIEKELEQTICRFRGGNP